MPKAGHDAVAAFAEWIFEFDTPLAAQGAPAQSVDAIHPERLECPLPQAALVHEWPGYLTKAGVARDRALRRGLADALAHGAITARFPWDPLTRAPANHPTYKLVPVLEGALMRAGAIRDVAVHAGTYPIDAVAIAGVTPDARPLHAGARNVRAYEQTIELHHPWDAADAARLIARQADLHYVGTLGGIDRPHWEPTADVTAESVPGGGWRPVYTSEAADEIYKCAEDASGVPVPRSAVPNVQYRGSRPIITAEMLALLPALERLPKRMRLSEALDDAAAPVIARKVARKPLAGVPDGKAAAMAAAMAAVSAPKAA